MAKPRNNVLDYLTYLAVRIFAMYVHMFGVRTNYRTARWIGDLLYTFDRRHRLRTMQHLKLSFPDWDERKIHRVAKASMRNMVYLALEVLFTTRLITPVRWRQHVRLSNMAETVRLMLRRESGLILVIGHFGNWEIAGYTLAALGFPSVVVMRPLDNPYLNRYLLDIRCNAGLDILYKKGATGSMDEVLDNKGMLGFVADQDAGRKGLFVDFFGRPASHYKAIALMAMRHNAPIIVGYGRRLDEAFHFELGTHRIIYPHQWAQADDPLLWITQQYSQAMEELIRKAPGQYLWSHRRWKHRPDGGAPGPDGVA